VKVFILLTCRKPELLPYTAVIFHTLRTGFPTADVILRSNALPTYAFGQIEKLAKDTDCQWEDDNSETIHHRWIEALVNRESKPFWICDTDIIFYESVERWNFETALAGWRIPEWQDDFSGSITRARLHGSLLYMDPLKIKAQWAEKTKACPETPFTPLVDPFNPLVQPINGRLYFHDTCSVLYHAIGGTAFTDRQKDAFFHFNFGTIPDLVLPRLRAAAGINMDVVRDAILADPIKGRGQWRSQEEYYQAFPVQPRPPKFYDKPISAEHLKEAETWGKVLCCGNLDAMTFCDLWYRYCHAIDDLLDTMEDGRPTMSQEQVLSIFFNAAFLYNCPFYRSNAHLLSPVVVMVTNMYADSVVWERSPIARRRIMADVLRTCGDEMYFAVALICGGERHMRDMSLKIRERDWIGQHDDNDQPN
jgi:hypothetical protein